MMKKTDLSFLSPEVAEVVRPVLEGRPAHIAFDADGTLWNNDIGDAFLQTLDQRGILPAYPKGGAWSVYQSLHVANPDNAYAFSTQVLAGLKVPEVEYVAKQFVELFVMQNLFAPMSKLVRLLSESPHWVWIVSASNIWCVRAAAAMLDIPAKRVIGVGLEQSQRGLLLPAVLQPAPIGPGKVDAIKAAGFRPALAVGNSKHDRPMLEYAASAFVVRGPGETTSDAVEMADQRNWPVLRIPKTPA